MKNAARIKTTGATGPITINAVISLFALSLALGAGACTHLFYAPSRDRIQDPRDEGFAYEELTLHASDGIALGAWLFAPTPSAPAKKPRGTVIHFHGNAENMSTFYQASAWLSREGYEVLTVDYRGYGASDGEPSPEGLNHDAVAALRWGQSRCDTHRSPGVIVFAQSLGGIVSLRALHDFKPTCLRAVIIDSSFGDYHRLGREKLASVWITWPLQWLANLLTDNHYAAEPFVTDVAPTPLLIIHGTEDRVVPLHHGRALYDHAAEPRTFWEIPGGHHIDAFMGRAGTYRPRLLKWLRER